MEPLSYAASILGGALMLPALWAVIDRLRTGRSWWLPAGVAVLGAMLFASLHVVSGLLYGLDAAFSDDAVGPGTGANVLALSVAGASIGLAAVARSQRRRNRAEALEARARRARDADEAAWAQDREVYDEALQRFLAYDKDLELLLANPMMRDYGDPMIREVMTTMAAADGAATERDHAAYRKAAREFSAAVTAAEATARRVRDAGFGPGERERIRKAQAMLAHAMDRSTDAGMRREIYGQIIKVLDGVIVVDEKAATETLALPGA